MSNLLEQIPPKLEQNLINILLPGETVLVQLKGSFKEALICTDRRVIILSSTGNPVIYVDDITYTAS